MIAMLVLTTAYITLFARELLHDIRMTILTNLLWVYNWWEIGHGQSYFDQFGGVSPFTHLWTLGVEAQFYLLWPLIIWGLYKLVHRKVIVRRIILILAILSAIEMAVLYDRLTSIGSTTGLIPGHFPCCWGPGWGWPGR
ncbi:MAG: hypothetical protein ACLSH6_00635 [Limosilactobacillus pontis]